MNVLNFVITGADNSGAGVIRQIVRNFPSTYCHTNLFHPEPSKRQEAHVSYFGDLGTEAIPEWCVPDKTNPVQYLTKKIFDNNINAEKRIGVLLTYADIYKIELLDLFSMRCQEGDFCMIHIVRNPILSFISMKEEAYAENSLYRGRPLFIDIDELREFVSLHYLIGTKIKTFCADCFEFKYEELVWNPFFIMQSLREFLQVPITTQLPSLPRARAKKKKPLYRVVNWGEIKSLKEFSEFVREDALV